MAKKTLHPAKGQARGNILLLAGVVGVVGGMALLGYGLAPAKDLWAAARPAFSGGTAPDDLSQRMDASMAELKGRALIDGLGFVALMTGIILVQQALAKPKSRPVEQLVQEEVARRLAAQPAPVHGASISLPILAAPAPAPAPVPPPLGVTQAPARAPAAAVSAHDRRTHCGACGSVLVAGGRICPGGHPQA